MDNLGKNAYELKSQGLNIYQIAHKLSIAPHIAQQAIEAYNQTERTNLAESLITERQLILDRLEVIYGQLMDELLNAETVICEVTGKVVVSKAKTKETLSIAILKILDARSKLLGIASVAPPTRRSTVDKTDVSKLSMDELKMKFTDLFR